MSEHEHSQETDPTPGCERFEQTLGLIDGLLEGPALEEARLHAEGCETCGPLVAGWAPLSDALFRAFEDAAEAAKPDLAAMPDRVFAAVRPGAAVPSSPGLLDRLVRFARRAQPWVLLGATAGALALVLPSLFAQPERLAEAPPAEAEEAPPVVVVRDLQFGDAEGMVYRTPRGGMTIVWVTANEDV